MLLSGFGSGCESKKREKQTLGFCTTKPWIIEIPRSVASIAIYWNISMHRWLKTYVFNPMKSTGKFKAILTTYLISSLLHGVNIQLAAVLLSVGLASYSEFRIRKKVSEIYNACILAHPCPPKCSHRFKTNTPGVNAFNIALGLIATFYLVYMGVMFEGPIEQHEMGLSYKHIIKRWGRLNYAGHWAVLISYVIFACV